MTGLLTMSKEEFARAALMRQVHERQITQRTAANMLGLSRRQVERLYRRYRAGGAESLVSQRRGRPSNHQLPKALKDEALALVRARYSDFGPTFAREKLVECHGLTVSKETLRKWMAED